MWLFQYLEKHYYYGPPHHDMSQFRNFGIYVPYQGEEMFVYFYEPRRELRYFKNRNTVTLFLQGVIPTFREKLGAPSFAQAFDDGTGTIVSHAYEWTNNVSSVFGTMSNYGTAHKCLLVQHLDQRDIKYELHIEVSPYV